MKRHIETNRKKVFNGRVLCGLDAEASVFGAGGVAG
jgi:hypothetical protein